MYRSTLLLVTLLFAVLSPSSLWAQEETGSIRGHVVSADGRPVELINIGLRGTRLGTTTDSTGAFELRGVPPGAYELVVSFVGLETRTVPVVVQAGQVTVLPTITLRETIATLDEITVADRTDTYRVSRASASLRLMTPLLELPQNIQVVTADLLADQQILNMREGVVRNVSGASEAEHWAQFTRVHMRGARIPAFRNGMNVASNWGPLSEDAALIERIEFVKGPAGFMMANGEPAGFYNVVTKKPTGQTRRAVDVTVGSFNLYRTTLDLDGRVDRSGRLLYRLNLVAQQNESFIKHDFQHRYAVAPVLTYRFDERTALTAEYTYQQARLLSPGSVYQFSANGFEVGAVPEDFTAADPSIDPTVIDDHNAFVTLTHRFSDAWRLTAQLAYFDYRVNGSFLWVASLTEDGDMQRSYGLWDSHLENRLGQIYLNGEFATGAVSHRLLAGLDLADKDYLAEFGQYGILGADVPFNIYHPTYGLPAESIPQFDQTQSLRNRANYTIAQSHTALYVQDEARFLKDRIRLTLAGRFTDSRDNDVHEQVFTPRLGLSVSPVAGTSLYGLYDQAYLPQAGAGADGTPFRPIRGHNLEAGLKHDWLGGQWTSTLAVYRIRKTNVLTADPENPNFSIQLGETQTQGVEVDLRGSLAPGLDLVLNYALTDATITKDTDASRIGDRFGGARHITNGWLSYRLRHGALRGLGLGLGYRWQLDRTSNWAAAGSQERLPNYFRLDGAISWQNERFSAALNLGNLLDATLYTGTRWGNVYYWQLEPPRTFRLRVGYRF
ncbi:TonB-dependent receptor [Rhodocaloribacter litoris]|uniref:TonB-dependent receptor n=1 Tax=Rhodocaloribacter litoris TaxID=2558931 RepID=UPI00141EEE0F|nr:TonB-dependent receptor [Rhodocaloribacter litoris]QXD14077.1 TonB-dependent receptor [Rhodocaloribacter litoris]